MNFIIPFLISAIIVIVVLKIIFIISLREDEIQNLPREKPNVEKTDSRIPPDMQALLDQIK